ncbi:MAG: hypothetical protein JWQ43_3992 [Glaciihabitans sp.]|nr:hypothetical protein [Glaciihabitans sp.]
MARRSHGEIGGLAHAQADGLWDDSYRKGAAVDQATRWARVLRGTLAAFFATFVAAFSHVLGGGALPSAAALSFTLAMSTLVCIALAGRVMSLWRTTLAVGVSQVLFHGLFSTMSSAGTVNDSATASLFESAAHAGHSSGSVTIGVIADGAPMVTHSSAMWLAHVVAGLVTILAVRYAENALVTVRETASLFLATLRALISLLPVATHPGFARVGCVDRILPRVIGTLISPMRHRGPPVSLTA